MTKPTNPPNSKKTYKKNPLAPPQPKFDSEGNIIKTIKTKSQIEAEKRHSEEEMKKIKKLYNKHKNKKEKYWAKAFKNGGKLKNRYPGGGRYQHD